MPRVVKSQSFFRNYAPQIMGSCYMVYGSIFYLLDGEMPIMLYFLIGAGAIVYGFLSKNSRKEYIQWDHEVIIIKDAINGKLEYSWDKIDEVRFSDGHLTIKSGKANGVMLELREYKEEDVKFLKNNFSSSEIMSISC